MQKRFTPGRIISYFDPRTITHSFNYSRNFAADFSSVKENFISIKVDELNSVV
ncbi:MAG: hypothetical protein ACHQFX_05040 [Chitinophagales bacterium]